ncbi:hypothetical protein H257_02960 [Aphanomyces astaci]|uniref:Lysosomal dipeptide transporter MFSD1 n=1 Tax=Aphanomyces astaci TaxID=112090 RepID=W4GZN9_APHAT|nr:hypothetical protein H257_02960 [Aphanomyces astaci]ETV85102.1 hypothetical protein H257_02960 [Aphanomyces astaci]|eukprot:XP_009825120.1 hypothetical protein H257_02960 [Aphanomyces astaci]
MLVPHETHIKPLVLLLTSLLNFGGCYCYDNPSALKSQLTQHFSGSVSKEDFEMYFNLLYSVYSVPNMVLPLFGGVLTDKFGPRYVLVATTSLMLLGQIVFATGNSLQNLPIMLGGRVIFGLGGETVSVAQSALLAVWFPASELAFANGVILSVMRLGTTVNNHVSPKVAQASSVSTAVWVGAGVCAVSVMASLLLLPIDARAEQQIHDDVLTDQENDQELQVKANLGLRDAATFSVSFWLIAAMYVLLYSIVGPFNNIAAGVYMERDYFQAPPLECQRCGVGALVNDLRCVLSPPSVVSIHCGSPIDNPMPPISPVCISLASIVVHLSRDQPIQLLQVAPLCRRNRNQLRRGWVERRSIHALVLHGQVPRPSPSRHPVDVCAASHGRPRAAVWVLY